MGNTVNRFGQMITRHRANSGLGQMAKSLDKLAPPNTGVPFTYPALLLEGYDVRPVEACWVEANLHSL